jgi:hypothetical protein
MQMRLLRCLSLAALSIVATAQNLLQNDEFEDGKAPWVFGRFEEIEPHGGYNGNSGLHVWRNDPKDYDYVYQNINLEVGKSYKLKAWVKAQNCQGTTPFLAAEFMDAEGKYISGVYPHKEEGTFDWTCLEATVIPPERTAQSRVALYLERGGTGQAWFDSVSISLTNCAPELYMVHPLQGLMQTHDEIVRLKLQRQGGLPEGLVNGWKLRLFIKTTEWESVQTSLAAPEVTLALHQLPAGPVTLQAELHDTADNIISTVRRTLLAMDSITDGPAGQCVIAERGRAWVDGQPFLPIGLFNWEFSNADDLARLMGSPFNCFMPYYSIGLTLPGQNTPPLNVAKIRALMDVLHRNGKKVIFCVKDFHPGFAFQNYMKNYVTNKFEPSYPDMDSLVTGLVTALKDHPALLAWYLNDEIRLSQVEMINARRELLNRLDPWHPTWGVLCHAGELPFYDHAHDILGMDVYPLLKADAPREQKSVVSMMAGANKSGLAAKWGVPQIFNWGNYWAKSAEEYHQYVTPSEEEMRAMTLMMAIHDIKGFVFYCDHDLKRPGGLTGQPQWEPQEVFASRWHDVVQIGLMLQDLAPFLLSDHDSQPVAAEIQEGNAELRKFVDNAGRVRILLSAIGPGPVRLRFNPESAGLRSFYGRCQLQSDGWWNFQGNDLACDILGN